MMTLATSVTTRHRQHAQRLAVGLVTALFAVGLIAACGGDDGVDATPTVPVDEIDVVDVEAPEPYEPEPEPEPEPVDTAALLATWAVYDEDSVEAEWQNLQRGYLAEAEAAGADPSQLLILASGPISWADYEAAMNRSIACIEALGRPVQQQLKQRDAPWPDLIFTNIPTRGGTACDARRCWIVEPDGVDLAAWECHARYALFVERAWMAPVEVLARFREQNAIYLPFMAQCLQARGIDVADNPTHDELWAISVSMMEAHPNCRENFLDDGVTSVGWGCTDITPANETAYQACSSQAWQHIAEVMVNR